MERVVDILSVDDRAVDADIPLRVRENSASDDRVLRSKNGAAALSHLFVRDQLVRPSPSLPSLVLLNAQLPVMSGAFLLDDPPGHPATRDLPLVFVNTDSGRRIHPDTCRPRRPRHRTCQNAEALLAASAPTARSRISKSLGDGRLFVNNVIEVS